METQENKAFTRWSFIIVAALIIALMAALSSNEPVTNLEVIEIVVVNKEMAF